ncbi:TPA: hypothetical protein IAB95_06100 [Candidatus Ventrenecus avicola]|nr:hypothetical protein [Candidatus Ventrenecus avicola]
MIMKFNDSEMQVTWTIEVLEKGEIEVAVFDQFDGGIRRVYTKKHLKGELLLSEKILRDIFEVAVNTPHDYEYIEELAKMLKGKEARIFESAVTKKLGQCVALIAILHRN